MSCAITLIVPGENISFGYANIYRLRKRGVKRPKTKFQMFINSFTWGDREPGETYQRLGHYEFVEEGYQAWQPLAKYEELCLTSQRFFETLYRALKSLDHCQCVTVTPGLWRGFAPGFLPIAIKTLLGQHLETSLIRSWTHCHVYPDV